MKLKASNHFLSNDRSLGAFTMIEVAMSLAIVAFALVAIMGVMPTGLNVQRQNAEETIISQDGSYLLEAMRQGVLATNLRELQENLTMVDIDCEFNPIGNPERYDWTNNGSNPKPSIENLVIQLARPRKTETLNNGTARSFYTNSVRLRFFSLSGNMTTLVGADTDKMQYEVQVEVISDGTMLQNTNVFNTNNFQSSFLQGNLHTVKLTYRWPILPTGRLGSGRKVLMTQFRGYLKPVKLDSVANIVTVETDDINEVQKIGQINTLPTQHPDGLAYGFVFEGAMLR